MRRFTDTLGDLEGGRLIDDLDAALNELVQTCRSLRKGGSLTVKIGISPNGEHSLSVAAKFDLNLPQPVREQTIMFAHPDGSLRKNDPRQLELPIVRQVPDVKIIEA